MSSVNLFSAPPHIAALMDLAMRRLAAELKASTAYQTELRNSHYRLLSMIPDEGARITDLAETAAMTKQALGQFVDYLQSHGYVESVRSEQDRRVRLVRRTAKGTAAREVALAAIARVERMWRSELGDRRYEALCDALSEVGQVARV
jgi:DNA-binding MarR family transcriptional regulator